jgi:hypothetical protein
LCRRNGRCPQTQRGTRIVRAGELRLDPPGIALTLAEIFGTT